MPLEKELSTFYETNGIAVKAFRCEKYEQCKRIVNNALLDKGSEAHLGRFYGTPFRVAVVTLDRGKGSQTIRERTNSIENLIPTNPHMIGTQDVLRAIFYKDNIRYDVFKHFAMTNSAKCCYKKDGMEMLPEACYDECAGFSLGEIQILAPDLLVTQGDYSKKGISGKMEKLDLSFIEQLVEKIYSRNYNVDKNLLIDSAIKYIGYVYINGKKTVHLHMIHPSAYKGPWQKYKIVLSPLSAIARVLVEGCIEQSKSLKT